MKKIISILTLAFAAFICSTNASAYSQEMQEFAQMMNQEAGSDGCSVSYDGTNIIMTFPTSFFSADERELFSTMGDLQTFAPIMVSNLTESMGAENLAMFAQLLAAYNTNLALRLNLGNTQKDIILTPDMLVGAE